MPLSFKTKFKWMSFLVLFLLGITLLIQNSEVVTLRLLFWQVSMSSIILILIIFLMGFLTGWILGRFFRLFGRSCSKEKASDDLRPEPGL